VHRRGQQAWQQVLGRARLLRCPGHAEYLVVPASDVAPVPAGVDLLDAATVPLNSLTAAQLLALLGAPTGRLLVTGAAGGVGGYAVALAARAGWAVTALARANDTGFLTRAGAGQVVTNLPEHPDFDAVLDAALLGEAALNLCGTTEATSGSFPARNRPPNAAAGSPPAWSPPTERRSL
jgi:NADPH:quinone reductase-like Zn-dependent oxidoreductase